MARKTAGFGAGLDSRSLSASSDRGLTRVAEGVPATRDMTDSRSRGIRAIDFSGAMSGAGGKGVAAQGLFSGLGNDGFVARRDAMQDSANASRDDWRSGIAYGTLPQVDFSHGQRRGALTGDGARNDGGAGYRQLRAPSEGAQRMLMS